MSRRIPQNREKQRRNKRENKLSLSVEPLRREEKLDLRDGCGVKDPTPFEAVKNIVRRQKFEAKSAPTSL